MFPYLETALPDLVEQICGPFLESHLLHVSKLLMERDQLAAKHLHIISRETEEGCREEANDWE